VNAGFFFSRTFSPHQKLKSAGWEIHRWFIRDRRFTARGIWRFHIHWEEFSYKEKWLTISLSSFSPRPNWTEFGDLEVYS